MEAQVRGRSPSTGHQNNQHIRSSPSPHSFNGQISQSDFSPPNQAFTQQSFSSGDLSPNTSGNINFNIPNTYLDTSNPPQFQQPLQNFDQTYQNGMNVNAQQVSSQPNQQFQSDMLNLDTRFGDFPHQQGFNKQELLLDPRLSDQSINPADLMSNMSSPQNLIPTPPTNYQMQRQHSEPTSPYSQVPPPAQQQSPHHSRNTSLDPTAAFTNGQQQDWSGMMQGPQFQGHRRTPSEYSDVSSSNAQSPYLTQGEGFESIEQQHSPLLNPQPDSQLYADGLGLETVNLSDPQQRSSPRHSPFVSPRMSPQPGLGAAQDVQFMGLPKRQDSFGNSLLPEPFGGAPTEQFPTVQPEQRLGSNDFGRADQYDVPQINVESAPNTQLSAMENARSPTDIDALSPPERGLSLDSTLRFKANRSSRTTSSRPCQIRYPNTAIIHTELDSSQHWFSRFLCTSTWLFSVSVRHGLLTEQLAFDVPCSTITFSTTIVHLLNSKQGLYT